MWDVLAPDPRTAITAVTLSTYHRWFASPLPDEDAEWVHAPCIDCTHVSHKHMISLVRFRTGNHDLLVDRQRRGPTAVARHARLCTLCETGEVQDAAHIMLACPHLDVPRQRFASVFSEQTATMRAMFTSRTNTRALAVFVHEYVRPINQADV